MEYGPYRLLAQIGVGRDGSWYKAEFRPRKDPLSELLDALVDQWLLPLLDLKLPALDSAMGVSAETNAMTAVVPPVKKTSCTSRPFFSKMPASLATQAGSASPLIAL